MFQASRSCVPWFESCRGLVLQPLRHEWSLACELTPRPALPAPQDFVLLSSRCNLCAPRSAHMPCVSVVPSPLLHRTSRSGCHPNPLARKLTRRAPLPPEDTAFVLRTMSRAKTHLSFPRPSSSQDIAIWMYRDLVTKVPLFKECEPAFIAQLVIRLRLAVFLPSEVCAWRAWRAKYTRADACGSPCPAPRAAPGRAHTRTFTGFRATPPPSARPAPRASRPTSNQPPSLSSSRRSSSASATWATRCTSSPRRAQLAMMRRMGCMTGGACYAVGASRTVQSAAKPQIDRRPPANPPTSPATTANRP